MSVHDRLVDLLLRYEDLIEQGQTPTAEEMCREFPECLEEFKKQAPYLAKVRSLVQDAPLNGASPRNKAEAADPKTLPQIPGFDILAVLGRGGMGVVYKARQHQLDRLVALKMILTTSHAGEAALVRFRTEAEAIARLQHPNIVQVFAIGEHEEKPYILFEFCPGGSLAQKIKGTPWPPADAARMVLTLARAIEAAHQKNIIHRDLKPGNVLLLEDGTPKITDFGLARKLDDVSQTLPGAVMGTPCYMAPEQAAGKTSDIGSAADIHALGATLYELLTGGPPFKADTVPETLKQVMFRDPIPPSRLQKVPRGLETICLKCLEKEMPERYGSAQKLAEDLQCFLDGKPIAAQPLGVPGRAWKWCKRRPAVAGLSVVVLLVAFVAFRIFVWGRDSDEQRALAERKAVQAAHAARVTAARQLAHRGNWPDALPAYDAAVNDRQEDALRLRVERLAGSFALNRGAELTAEFDALNQMQLGDLTAPLRLVHGAWLLCHLDQQDKGRALVQKALADRQHLSPADVAFAESLLAERIGQSMGCLRRAVQADPFHYFASTSLAMAQATVGDVEQAGRQTQFLRDVFPFSPMPDIIEAVIAIHEDNPASMKKSLAKVLDQLPADSRPKIVRLQQWLLAGHEVHKSLHPFHAGEDTTIVHLISANGSLGKFDHVGNDPEAEPLGLPVPMIHLVHRRLSEVYSVSLETLTSGPEQHFGIEPGGRLRFPAVLDDYPDVGLSLVASSLYFKMAHEPVNRGDVATTRKYLEAISELGARALRAPNIMRRAPVPYRVRVLGNLADLGVLKLIREPAPIHLQRVRENLHLLVSEGEKWPKLREQAITLLIQMTAAPLSREQCADWNLADPEGRSAFNTRKQHLSGLAVSLLNDWAGSERDNPALPRLRARVAEWEKSSGIVEKTKSLPVNK